MKILEWKKTPSKVLKVTLHIMMLIPMLAAFNGIESIRLVGGRSNNSGTVEIIQHGQKRVICDNHWHYNNAVVVCRTLGFKYAKFSEAFKGNKYGYYPFDKQHCLPDKVICNGTESNVTECKTQEVAVGERPENVAGVYCIPNTNPIQVRLLLGETETSGAVQVIIGRKSGMILTTTWNAKARTVICRMLGSKHPVLLARVVCKGTEKSILECQITKNEVYKEKGRVAAASCAFDSSNLKAYLIAGEKPDSGIPAVIYKDKVISPCASSFDKAAAEVYCRMMGYRSVSVSKKVVTKIATKTTHFMQNLACTGLESSIFDCHMDLTKRRICERTRLQVDCNSGNDLRIKLTKQSNPESGGIELEFNGEIGVICHESWSSNVADVVCRMMGFRYSLNAYDAPGSPFQTLSTGLFFNGFYCDGNETSITQCQDFYWKNNSCSGYNRTSRVVCMAYDGGEDFGISLVNDTVTLTLREETAFICQDSWASNKKAADVVCRMMGHRHALVVWNIEYSDFQPDPSSLFLGDFVCNGSESSIFDCEGFKWTDRGCAIEKTAGLFCLEKGVDVEVELVNGTVPDAGMVMLGVNGQPGAICLESWDKNASDVVCRMMGYERALETEIANMTEFEWSFAEIYLNNFQCTGEESTILDCPGFVWENRACFDDNDIAGVVCKPYDPLLEEWMLYYLVIPGCVIFLGIIVSIIVYLVFCRQRKQEKQAITPKDIHLVIPQGERGHGNLPPRMNPPPPCQRAVNSEDETDELDDGPIYFNDNLEHVDDHRMEDPGNSNHDGLYVDDSNHDGLYVDDSNHDGLYLDDYMDDENVYNEAAM